MLYLWVWKKAGVYGIVIGTGTNGTNAGPNGTNGTNHGTNVVTMSSNQKVLGLMEADPGITQKRLAEQLGISLRTVKRITAEMQQAGAIERVGSNVTGYWKVSK